MTKTSFGDWGFLTKLDIEQVGKCGASFFKVYHLGSPQGKGSKPPGASAEGHRRAVVQLLGHGTWRPELAPCGLSCGSERDQMVREQAAGMGGSWQPGGGGRGAKGGGSVQMSGFGSVFGRFDGWKDHSELFHNLMQDGFLKICFSLSEPGYILTIVNIYRLILHVQRQRT